MTAEAYHYDDLHSLVDRLNPDQARAMRAVALQLVATTPDSGQTATAEPDPVRRRMLSIAGIVEAEPDLAERSEDILRELVERRA